MKNKVRILILVLSIVVFVGSASGIALHFYLQAQAKKQYEATSNLAGLGNLNDIKPPVDPDPPVDPVPADPYEGLDKGNRVLFDTDPYAQALKETDWDALLEKNPDTKGWIFMPGTEISYPIVQGTDNDHYLTYTFDGYWNNAVGSIYLDYRCDPTLQDFHTIIYGHRLNRGSMFSELNGFTEDPEFYKDHTCFYIALIDGSVYRYDIYAACEAPVPGDTWRLGLKDEYGKQAYIDYNLYLSVIEPLSIPTTGDKVITLSTCTGHGHHSRCVVQGYQAAAFVETERELYGLEPLPEPEPAPEAVPES